MADDAGDGAPPAQRALGAGETPTAAAALGARLQPAVRHRHRAHVLEHLRPVVVELPPVQDVGVDPLVSVELGLARGVQHPENNNVQQLKQR